MSSSSEPPKRSLGERIRRVFATPEQREAGVLGERTRRSGAETIAGAEPRSRVRVRGVVTAVTSAPRTGWLEAELDDGTGTLTLVWMSRRRLEVIQPGVDLLVSGRLAGDDGRKVIHNPDYEVMP